MTSSPTIDQRNSCELRSVGIYPLYCICTCCKRTKWRIISSRQKQDDQACVTREKAISLSVRSRASSEKRVDMGIEVWIMNEVVFNCLSYVYPRGPVVNLELSRPGNQSDIHLLGGTPQLAPSSKATAIHACPQSSTIDRKPTTLFESTTKPTSHRRSIRGSVQLSDLVPYQAVGTRG